MHSAKKKKTVSLTSVLLNCSLVYRLLPSFSLLALFMEKQWKAEAPGNMANVIPGYTCSVLCFHYT